MSVKLGVDSSCVPSRVWKFLKNQIVFRLQYCQYVSMSDNFYNYLNNNFGLHLYASECELDMVHPPPINHCCLILGGTSACGKEG
jgi:hypothetical protein